MKILVSNMTTLSPASVSTTSTSGSSNINYPQLTPISHHSLYQHQGSSSMMNSDFNHSPTNYQQSFTMLDVIKMENGTSLSRSLSEVSVKDEKALELKSNRQLPTLTSIESR